MGCCISREFFTAAHKDYSTTSNTTQTECPPATLHAEVQPPSPEPERPDAPPQDVPKKCFKTSNGILAETKSTTNSYDITELATSSLVGLVQTIKDHITKPTAMARGRVAHLIEWKGWNTQQTGWDPSLTDEEHYSCLTDELKEARFAAGVAEQFAVTEATLSAWSSLEDEEVHYGNGSQEVIQLQDLESLYLHGRLLSFPHGPGGSILDGSLQPYSGSALASPARTHPYLRAENWIANGAVSAETVGGSPPPGDSRTNSSERQEQTPAGDRKGVAFSGNKHLLNSAIHYVDSSSLSEDEVFYN
ncbi:protein FAM131C isoform X2 [Ambystoma mexicanum]|uniref:protein FAM131C isoform X2 n=1 Tax=Ambystoma mexicanum TaxID=8296 RepID=UPI0037E75631